VSIENIDIRILQTLNEAFGQEGIQDKLVTGFGNNPMLRGFPVFFCLIVLWFLSDSIDRRGRILVGLLATCVATVLSVWLQYHITIHIRPFLDPALNLRVVDPRALDLKWERLGSFPSDTSTLYLSLGTVILLENRLAGVAALLWALITVGLLRVIMGYHYPSDIAGALVLGPGCVMLFARIRPLLLLSEHVLRLFQARMYVVHALMFLFLADAYNVFSGLQGISHGAGLIGKHLVGR
jgi:membrane-associated phospholipid phosphatase